MTSNNHIVIGLGGTGGRIIRELRKLVARDGAAAAGADLEYWYVDSDAELMQPDDASWRLLGRLQQLRPAQQLLLHGDRLPPCFEGEGVPPSRVEHIVHLVRERLAATELAGSLEQRKDL
jgi:hypothetical protein